MAIIGSGFIGSEAASALKMQYKDQFDVHMIGMEEFPLEMALGKEVAKMIAKEHAEAGVKMYMKNGVKEIIKDQDGNVKAVLLNDGQQL